MPCVVLVGTRVLDVLLVFLIDRVVREVGILVMLRAPPTSSSLGLRSSTPTTCTSRCGCIIRLAGEACETFIVDIDAPGVQGGDEHVDPKVEFEPIDQEGVGDVATHDAGLIDGDLTDVIDL